MVNESDSDCDGINQTQKEKRKLSSKKAAALLADLFWDQYLYNKKMEKRNKSQIDETGNL